MNNIALILAGGVGIRAGQDIPKQFIEVNRKPVICYTIEKFLCVPEISEILVVCLENWIPKLQDYVKLFNYRNVHICKNGKTGLDSVYQGIQALKSHDEDDLILIHDAARPFIDSETIHDNIRIAQKYNCALTAVDCVETLAYTEDGLTSNKIIQRDYLKRIMTPQTFRLKILREIFSDHENILKSKNPSTFCLYVESGYPVYCSKGNERNIKITYPEDVEYFKKFF